MGKVNEVKVKLSFVDKFTLQFNKAIQHMERGQKQAKRLGKQMEEAGNTMSSIGAGMTKTFTTPILDAGVASFKLASDLEESLNKVDSTFGKSAKGVKEWSKTTLDTYGLSQSSALELAASYGDMAKSMGISSDKAGDMSQKLAGLTGDLASYKNISTDVAKNALSGVFTGDTESLKQLGVSMSNYKLNKFAKKSGSKKSYKDMNDSEKVQLRYNYVMKKTASIQGGFSKSSGRAATQVRLLSENAKQLGASFGQQLLPYGIRILKMINNLIKWFTGLSKSQKDIIIRIAGIVAVMGPLLSVFGRGITIFGKFYKNTGNIIKGLKNARKHAGDLKKSFGKLQEGASGMIKAFGKTAKNALDVTKAFIKNKKESIKSTAALVKKTVAEKAAAAASKAMALAQKAVNIAFKTTPIGWIILGITALIAVGVLLVKNWGKIKAAAGAVWKFVKNTFGGIGKWFGGIWDGVKGTFKSFINFLIKGINKIPQALNSIKITLPSFMGGHKIGFNIPEIPYLAKGTSNWQGGLAITQEKGGEIMDLPRGTRVYPHDESVRMAHREGQNKGAKSIVINKLADKIEVRSQSDLDSLVNKLADKLQKIIDNGGGEVYA